MPNAVVKSYAKKSGKSVEQVEKIWKDTEASAHKAHPEWKKGDKLYAYVNGTVAKRLGLKESIDDGGPDAAMYDTKPPRKPSPPKQDPDFRSQRDRDEDVIGGDTVPYVKESADDQPREDVMSFDSDAWREAVFANPKMKHSECRYAQQVIRGEEGDFDIEPQHRKLINDYYRIKKEKAMKESATKKGNESTETLKKVGSAGNYDFYKGSDEGRTVWNIVPKGSKAPAGGYHDKGHIEKVKGVKFPVTESVNDAGPVKNMRCSVCGARTLGRQHSNMDTGYGICPTCFDKHSARADAEAEPRGHGAEWIWGKKGVHHSLPESGSLIGAESPSQCNSQGMFESLLHLTKGVKLGEASTHDDNTVSLFSKIRKGDRVTILTPQGQERSGRAVMRGPAGWVLNMGGAHGTPGIASDRNVVRVRGVTESFDPSTHPFNQMMARKGAERMAKIAAHYKKDAKDVTNDEIIRYNQRNFKKDDPQRMGESTDKAEGDFGYIAFYKGKKMEVYAKTKLAARDKAAKAFGAKKPHEVEVELAERPDGSDVVHIPLM
jgi:hypothetical protein